MEYGPLSDYQPKVVGGRYVPNFPVTNTTRPLGSLDWSLRTPGACEEFCLPYSPHTLLATLTGYIKASFLQDTFPPRALSTGSRGECKTLREPFVPWNDEKEGLVLTFCCTKAMIAHLVKVTQEAGCETRCDASTFRQPTAVRTTPCTC